MARLYSTEKVISYWDIPLPEEDVLSDDDFNGYTSDKNEDQGDNDRSNSDGDNGRIGDNGGNGDNDGESDGNDGESDGNDGGSDGNYEIPEFMRQSGCTLSQMTNKSPLVCWLLTRS